MGTERAFAHGLQGTNQFDKIVAPQADGIFTQIEDQRQAFFVEERHHGGGRREGCPVTTDRYEPRQDAEPAKVSFGIDQEDLILFMMEPFRD